MLLNTTTLYSYKYITNFNNYSQNNESNSEVFLSLENTTDKVVLEQDTAFRVKGESLVLQQEELVSTGDERGPIPL